MIEHKDYKETEGYKNRWKGMIFIGISLIVISIDNTILNVALPSISRDLGASASELQWVVTAYVLMFAALLLTMGALGDRFGRKRMLQIGLVLFGLGSAAAGLSTSTNMLIATRAFLGFGGAIIMPSTLSIITATFPREEQPRAIAMWAAIFGLGIGIGPVLGGWLIEILNWNSVFFINLPIVVVAIIGGSSYLMESRDESARRIDFPGIFLSIPGLFALVYAIIEAGNQGWSAPEVLTVFGIAAVLLIAFAVWESRAKEPMLPLYFFKNMSFTAANLAMVLVMFAMFGSIFFMSQYLQSVIGYSALEAGVRMLPLALTMVVASIASSRVAGRIGTKYTVALGIFIAGLGLLYMSQFFAVDSSYATIIIGIILLPLGLGMTMSPATNSVMQSIPTNKAGIGSAMNDTTRQLGGALGVAILGTLMNNVYVQDIQALKATLGGNMPAEIFNVIESSIQGANIIVANAPLPDAVKLLILDTANAAFVNGMTSAMLIGAGLMFTASLLTLAILPAKVRSPESQPSEMELEPATAAATD